MTPTLYNVALACPARAAWTEFGDRNAFPSSPQSVLGTAFHAVTEDAARGLLPTEPEQRRQAAERRFDASASSAWTRVHPLLRWRYGDPRDAPFYYTRRAEAVETVADLRAGVGGSHRPLPRAEWAAASHDGVLQGRIDYVDVADGFVVDYKSGGDPPEGQAVLETEARQLRLYASLCAENGIAIQSGVIVRRGGRRDVLPIAPWEAEEEARRVRELLTALNSRIAAGQDFLDLAAPSPENCRFCPCRPICGAFWRAAGEDWAPNVGCCAEVRVESVTRRAAAGGAVLTMGLHVLRGTVSLGPRGPAPFPAALAEADGSLPPDEGDTLRLIDTACDDNDRLLRPMRNALTTVWSV